MPDLPYPLMSDELGELKPQILDMFRDIYENRVGGATVGDVFQIGGEVLELKLKSGSGLTKTNGELDIDLTILGSAGGITKTQYTAKGVILVGTGASSFAAKTVGADGSVLKASSADSTGTVWANVTAAEVTNTPAGSIEAATVQAAINELDTEKTTLTAVKADADVADAISKKHAVGDSIASSISDGDTTHSPDGNSVFDALALKLAKASNLSDVANAATAFGNIKQAATTGATGVVELATQAEVLAGTDTSRAVVPVDLHAKMAIEKNPLAFAQGIAMTYAASGSSGIAVANNSNINFGTGNFTIVRKVALPDWTPSTLVRLMWKYQSNALRYDLFINTDGKVSLQLNGTEWKSSTTTGLTDGVEAEIAATVTVGETNTLVDFYVNGIVLGMQISHANVGTVSNNGTLYILGLDTVRYAGINKSALAFNRALSATEVLSLYQNGVAEADKWGNQTGPVSGCVLALEPEGVQPAPGQWLDSSSNKLHAWQPAAGSSLTRYKNTFEIRGINTWAGTHEAQSIAWATDASKAILPAGCYIDSIIGVITGATIEDIIIGDGSDTDRWVEATTGLAAGTVSFTIANHTSDGTNYEMVVDPDANFTGSIEWTIRGTILD